MTRSSYGSGVGITFYYQYKSGGPSTIYCQVDRDCTLYIESLTNPNKKYVGRVAGIGDKYRCFVEYKIICSKSSSSAPSGHVRHKIPSISLQWAPNVSTSSGNYYLLGADSDGNIVKITS